MSDSAWTETNSNSKPKEGIRNLKIASGPGGQEAEYTVRFVGDPITFYKYFVNNKSAICADPNTCPVKLKYNIDPGVRHAVNLINRADGQLYLSEVPPSVIKPVVAWVNAMKKRGLKADPGGVEAVDFSITVKGQKKDTRYTVVALNASNLTDVEQQMVRYDLKKLFKPTPDTEIEAKLFGGGTGGASAPTEQAPKAATTAAKPIAQDLPF